MNARLGLALLLPFLALALQWVLWPWIAPFVWFLFFPAVFFSARLGGLRGGLASTVLSAGMAWFFFIPPSFSWTMDNPSNVYSVGLFLVMGYLLSDAQERLLRAQRENDAALRETRAANDKITQLYRQTLELDELKTQFFANVSHELRTPLTLIMSPLAKRLAAAGVSEGARREDEMMLRNARILYRHVNDLLDAAKLEAGRMSIDYARLDIGELVRGVAVQFDSMARERGLAYRIDVPSSLEAEGDGEKIQRILLNLLSNAFKFAPDGGRIEVRLRQETGQAVIEVQDNGPGVSADLREAVFERFRQVDGGAQRRYAGTGLGLAIVRQFAELHGGNAELAEAPGGGALFIVRLPIGAPAGAAIHETASRLDPALGPLGVDDLQLRAGGAQAAPGLQAGAEAPLVLVVEDNPDMNAFITDTLRPHYRTASALDGREGLEKALALQPDLIVCDVMMPGMSGDQMVPELRRQPAMDGVPIVMLTARADDALRVRLFGQGVQGYLNKPFATDELLARVGALVASRRRTVDELRRSEVALKASESALKVAQRIAGVGSWGWDVEADAHTWSEEVYRIYGRDPALPPAFYPEVAKYFTPESWAVLAATVESSVAEGLSYQCDAEVVRPDGSHRWVTARGEAVRNADGKVVGLHGTVQDITERKHAEMALRESESRFRALVEQTLTGIYIIQDGRFCYANPGFAAIFGFDTPEALIDRVAVEELVAPEDRARVAENVRRRVDGEMVDIHYAFVGLRRDGTRIDVEVHGRAVGYRGRPAVIGVVLDITERKRAEAEIHRLNADLERRVAERTRELTGAVRELDSFAYAVSHDLRAPLRAMSGFSQALIEDYGNKLDGEAKGYLDQIGIASRKMGELIDGILALSRTTRGELQRVPVDISALATALLEELGRCEPERAVRWRVEPDLKAMGDGRMIEAVLANLLGNAWKYTMHAAQPAIRVYAEEQDGTRRFCIADNGAGFDMAHANRLFQPFQRLHRQEEFPGIGIGLATVQRIVHRHGGVVDARGEPAKGAVFCFTLPSAPTRSAPDEKEIQR